MLPPTPSHHPFFLQNALMQTVEAEARRREAEASTSLRVASAHSEELELALARADGVGATAARAAAEEASRRAEAAVCCPLLFLALMPYASHALGCVAH